MAGFLVPCESRPPVDASYFVRILFAFGKRIEIAVRSGLEAAIIVHG
jgi:hypothetical protein